MLCIVLILFIDVYHSIDAFLCLSMWLDWNIMGLALYRIVNISLSIETNENEKSLIFGDICRYRLIYWYISICIYLFRYISTWILLIFTGVYHSVEKNTSHMPYTLELPVIMKMQSLREWSFFQMGRTYMFALHATNPIQVAGGIESRWRRVENRNSARRVARTLWEGLESGHECRQDGSWNLCSNWMWGKVGNSKLEKRGVWLLVVP
jgi:hypothetical protein